MRETRVRTYQDLFAMHHLHVKFSNPRTRQASTSETKAKGKILYWSKVHLGFSVKCYRKVQINFFGYQQNHAVIVQIRG